MLFRQLLLNPSCNSCTFRRGIQVGYFKDRPRSYRRRLYEAALAPILPKQLEKQWKETNDPFNIHSTLPDEKIGGDEFTKFEMALVERLREWMAVEKFRVMAICQLNAVKEETLWLAKNHFRLNGVEFCDEPSKILCKVFERSRLSLIAPLLVDECTCLLFGKEPEQSIHHMVSTCDAYAWIRPIAFAVDSRILSVDVVSELAPSDSLQRLRLEMVQMTERTLRQLPSTVDDLVEQIPRTLDAHLKAISGQ
ncbi:hypothetical protein GPALN_011066 [Globodera pallida]|nr:hypothetical protein GPALN_011066 [Globodera pallida]